MGRGEKKRRAEVERLQYVFFFLIKMREKKDLRRFGGLSIATWFRN